MAVKEWVDGEVLYAADLNKLTHHYYDEDTNATEYSVNLGATAESSVTLTASSENAYIVGVYLQCDTKETGNGDVNVGLKIVGTNLGTKYVSANTRGTLDPDAAGSSFFVGGGSSSYQTDQGAICIPIGLWTGDTSYTVTALATDPNNGGTTYLKNVTIRLVFAENYLSSV